MRDLRHGCQRSVRHADPHDNLQDDQGPRHLRRPHQRKLVPVSFQHNESQHEGQSQDDHRDVPVP